MPFAVELEITTCEVQHDEETMLALPILEQRRFGAGVSAAASINQSGVGSAQTRGWRCGISGSRSAKVRSTVGPTQWGPRGAERFRHVAARQAWRRSCHARLGASTCSGQLSFRSW